MERVTYRKCLCPYCQKGRVKKVINNGQWWGRCNNDQCDESLATCRILCRRRQNGRFIWGCHHIRKAPVAVQEELKKLSRQGKIPFYIGKILETE